MKIENSSQVPTATLRPLLAFALKRTPLSNMARLEILPGAWGKTTGGYAFMYHPEKPDPIAPSLVRLWVSAGGRCFIPHLQQHVPELAPFPVYTWEEELLLVIAHELAHIRDFWTRPDKLDDAHWLEVSAETFAIDTVKAWREAKATKRAA